MAKKSLEYASLLEEEKLTVDELPLPIRKRINVLRPLIAKHNAKPTENLKNAIIKADVEIAEMIADYIEKDLPEQNDGDDDDNNGKPSKNNNRSNNNSGDDDDSSNADGDDNNGNGNNNKNNNKPNKVDEKKAAEIAAEKAAERAAEIKAAIEKSESDKIEAAKAAKLKEDEEAEAEQKKKDDAKKPITNFGTLDMEKKITENCSKNNGFISEKDLISIIGKSPEYPKQTVYSITLKKVFLKSLYQLL